MAHHRHSPAAAPRGQRLTTVVNLFGGPSSRKTTLGQRLTPLLKEMGLEVLLASEFAQRLELERNRRALKNQLYVAGNQWYEVERGMGIYDVVVTDSPILLSGIYAPPGMPRCFHEMLLWHHHRCDNINFMMTRPDHFSSVGRKETQEESLAIDAQCVAMLKRYGLPFKGTTDSWADAAIAAKLIHDHHRDSRGHAAGWHEEAISPKVPF